MKGQSFLIWVVAIVDSRRVVSAVIYISERDVQWRVDRTSDAEEDFRGA